MKIAAENRTHELREHMRGGEGTVILDTVPGGQLPMHTRMVGVITLEKGCSIGSHAHQGETEIFIIHSGSGRVNDNGEEKAAAPGDIILTGGGASHSIMNTGEDPLVLSAVIVTEA